MSKRLSLSLSHFFVVLSGSNEALYPDSVDLSHYILSCLYNYLMHNKEKNRKAQKKGRHREEKNHSGNEDPRKVSI